MPFYIFERESTGEVREVMYGMNDAKAYRGTNGDQPDWKRVFTIPQASLNTKIDPNSSADFVKKLEGKKETIGSMWDRSAELSAQRAEKHGGVDPVKQQYFKNYSKTRRGAKHPGQKREEAAAHSKKLADKVKKIMSEG